MMKEVQLKLTVEELNKILTSLGNQPFFQVHELIGKIQIQAEPQLKNNGSEKSKVTTEKQGVVSSK